MLVTVLVSGAGLAALGVYGAVHMERAARDLAEATAHESAVVSARALARGLRDPELVEAFPTEARFRASGGALRIPPHVGWTVTPPPSSEFEAIDDDVLTLVHQARRAGDTAVEATFLKRALAACDENDTRSAFFVRLEQAWTTWRRDPAGDQVELPAVDESVRRLDLAGALLLLARRGRPWPPEYVEHVGRLTGDEFDGLVDRLGSGVEALQRAWRAAAATRARLVVAEARLPQILAAQEPTQILHDSADGRWICLWYPSASSSTGDGAVVRGDELVDVLSARTGIEARRITFAPTSSDRAVLAGAVLAVEPTVVDAPGGRWWLIPLVVGLAAVLGFALHRSLRALQRETDAARSRADFLTSVTHELKTPLASIRLLSEMLENERVPDDRRRSYAALLVGETARLSTIVENVLDLGRVERGERAYDLRPCRMDEIIREAVDAFAPVGERDGLRVVAETPEAASALVDRDAVIQAFVNVMDNARKYASEGGTLDVESVRENGHLVVRMRDHGPGVDPCEREAVFDRFQRGTPQADGSIPGVGLGLYLARTIVRAQGGDLSCVAPPDAGPGACFEFTLPLEDV